MTVSFSYTGRAKSGEKLSGAFVAESRERALESLEKREVIVTSIEEFEVKPPGIIAKLFRPDYSKELVLFSRHLATYHRSGIPLLKALSLIRLDKENSPFQEIIYDVRTKIAEGKPLSNALADHPDAFPDVFVSAVAAGEASGQLAQILDETSDTLDRELELRHQIRSSLRYPVIVLGAIVVAIGIVITFVIPKFASFYSKFGSELPLPTKVIIWISDFAQNQWYVVLTVMVSVFLGFRKWKSTESGRSAWDRFLLKLPVFGELIIKASTARFALLWMILFKSGIPIVKSLDILLASMSNIHIQAEVARMRESFEAGRELDQDPDTENYFPEMALNMIRSGLESGSMDMMLEEIGKHYSREVSRTSKNLAILIEPLLTIVIGGLVLVLALSIFLPMWNLIKVFH